MKSRLNSTWRSLLSAKDRQSQLKKLCRLADDDLIPNLKNISEISESMVEQVFGVTVVPTSIAGPAVFSYKSKVRNLHVPLATTESALVASTQRGFKAISEAGNCLAISIDNGMTRAPVFSVRDLNHANESVDWIVKNKDEIAKVARGDSRYTKLTDVQPLIFGRGLYLRLIFQTGEAMGMNMVTFAAERVVDYLKHELGLDCIALSSNFCTDKKPNWINPILGRGVSAQAEVIVSKEQLSSVLKTTPKRFFEVIKHKNYLGSALAGSMGNNSQAANIVAAIFLATGQDMAHVGESSLCFTSAEILPDGVHVNVKLPNLIIGTVGGGTKLPTQRRCLKILGLDMGSKGDKEKFGAIIAVTVLAAELSLTAALASGDLAKAHYSLSRQVSMGSK